MRKRLVSMLCSTMVLVGFHVVTHAQGIVATYTSDGRLVYENAPEKPSAPAGLKNSGNFYWSNTEYRWKPVPPAYSQSMRDAHSAANEVRRLLRQAARGNSRFMAVGNALLAASQQVQNSPSANGLTVINPGSAPPGGAQWIDNIVQQAAMQHEVDPNLVRAIIKVESNFNPHAVSRKGAMGLMQLMPSTAKSLNVSNPYDPAQNVDAGVRHFKQLLDSYNGNVELSLAAYNAGSGAVHRSRGVPKYTETRNYVKRITSLYASNGARQFTIGHPLEFKRDAEGHLSVSDIE
ncbi:MAG TPA: lytic transglycosylase domain-containing protein [Terriglobales bacterium]|nr:lytic transglycosylase domain-containing protein [Terriglobales bacterium]